MIVDARSLPHNQQIDTDVCIVGGGVAGITVAREFIGQPFRVCLLESGGMEPAGDTQALSGGENVGHPYFQLELARPRCFGGAAYNWFLQIAENRPGIQLRPLDPIDFEERDWVPYSGWPFKRAHLDPLYERAQAVCRLGPFKYRSEDWADPERKPSLPLLNGRVETVIFQLGERDTFITHHRAEITRAENITTYLHATVTEIETDSAGRTATRLRMACSADKVVWVTAKLFILALGAVETPRLLLLSNRRQREGLGNGNDLVGRFFMEHPHLTSGTYITSKLHLEQTLALYSFPPSDNGRTYGRFALSEETLRKEQLLNWTVSISPKFWPLTVRAGLQKVDQTCRMIGNAVVRGNFRDCGRHLKFLVPFVFNEVSAAVGRKMIGLLRRRVLNYLFASRKVGFFSLQHMSEQAPNPSSRVTLSEELDCFGQRQVKLDWRLSAIDIRTLLRGQQILDEELQRAGLGRLEIEMEGEGEVSPPDLHGGWHHMGTTRMHHSPKQGVVNEHCLVHGINNLFIAGPSTFPTGGYANPTLTIVALAIRLADHIKQRMASY